MKWSEAVRKWNESRGWRGKSEVKWITPKKGSAEHAEVMNLMKSIVEAAQSTGSVPPPPLIPVPMMLSGAVSSVPAVMSVIPDTMVIPMRRKAVVPPVPGPPVPSIIGLDVLRRFIEPTANIQNVQKIASDAEDPSKRDQVIQLMRRGSLVFINLPETDSELFSEMTDKDPPAGLDEYLSVDVTYFESPLVNYPIEIRRTDYTVRGSRRSSELIGPMVDHGYDYRQMIAEEMENQEVNDDDRVRAYRDFAQTLLKLANKPKKTRDDINHINEVTRALLLPQA
jgi:hypothetical protein